MNLLQIRTKFVQQNGRYDLVTSQSSFTDNGANFFIQAGQRLLDDLNPTRKELSRFVKDISVGQSSVFMKHIRSIDSVYVKASGEARSDLYSKPYSWMIEEYGEDFGEQAKGIGTFSALPSNNETLTIGTETYTFKTTRSASYQVAIATTISVLIDNLVSEINTYSSLAKAYKLSATTFCVEYYLVGTAGNAIAFSTTSAGLSLDGSGYLGGALAGRANLTTQGTPMYFTVLQSTPHPEITLSTLGSYETSHLYFGLDRFQKDGIFFLPAADKAYTMHIFAQPYSLLENDLDISYHSEMKPELLIMAANFVLEATYRNRSGMDDWGAAIKKIVDGMDKSLALQESQMAGNQFWG